MIRRSLITSALVLAGAVTAAPSVFAQTVEVPFSGIVPGACSFGNPTPGILTSDSYGMGTSTLTSLSPGGSSGQVTVTCNESANLHVSTPVQTGGPSVTPVSSSAYVDFYPQSYNQGPLSLNSSTQQVVYVDMEVENSPLLPGTYEYGVTLTVTPY